MNVQVFEARNYNALKIIEVCVAALRTTVPLPEQALETFKTIKPGDQDVYSLYHREAVAQVLHATCAHLSLVVAEPRLLDVQSVIDAQEKPPKPEAEGKEGKGDADPA